MQKTLFGITALSCILSFVPAVSAMQSGFASNDDIFIENVCDPDLIAGSSLAATLMAPLALDSQQIELDYQQVEDVRIELLERGFNPGFDPERDNATNPQLSEALRRFQSENDLPMTGQIDAPTLAALSITIHKPVHRVPDGQLQRAD